MFMSASLFPLDFSFCVFVVFFLELRIATVTEGRVKSKNIMMNGATDSF